MGGRIPLGTVLEFLRSCGIPHPEDVTACYIGTSFVTITRLLRNESGHHYVIGRGVGAIPATESLYLTLDRVDLREPVGD